MLLDWIRKLKEGTNEEKRELMGCFKSKFKVNNGTVTIEGVSSST